MTSERDPAIEEILAIRAIEDLLATFAHAVDRLDPDLLPTVFFADATVDYGAYCGSIEGFLPWVIELERGFVCTHHFLGKSRIDVEGDVAFGETYYQAYVRTREDGEAYDGFFGGRYIDRFEKRGGVWKIAHRTALHDYAHKAPASHETPAPPLGARGPDDLSNQREKLRTL